MERVGVEFSGNGRGAVTAAKETAAAVDQVTRSAHQSSPGLRNMEHDLGKLERGALSGSGALRGLGRSVAFASAGFLGGYGLAAAVRGATDELVNTIKIGAQVDQVIRNTGGVAGITAAHINALADAEQRKTGIDNDLIKKAEVVLLTFTKVRDVAGQNNDVFDRATKAAADLGTQMGDTSQAATLLGKSLQDPVHSFGQLRRAGIILDESTKHQIKTLVEHGDVLAAQKIILDQVEGSVGGLAKRVGDAAPWMRLRETLKNLSAEAIKPLLPEVDSLTGKVQKWADELENNSEAQQRLKDDVNQAVSVVKDFASGADAVAGALGGWKTTAELLIGLKMVSTLGGWASALQKVIGTIGTATGGRSGLAGADGAATGLLSRLRTLVSKPWVIAVALSFIPPDAKGQAALDKAGIGWLGRLPFIGHLNEQAGALGLRIRGGDGMPSSSPNTNPGISASDILKYPNAPIFPVAGTRGKIIGVPGAGTHSFTTGPNNWESDNAIDIAVKVGTKVVAIVGGTIGQQIGPLDSSDPKMAGLRLHLIGDDGNEYYYAHLSVLYVKAGQQVKRGDVLGLSGSANGTAHLHFASKSGNPMQLTQQAPSVATDASGNAKPPPPGGGGGSASTNPLPARLRLAISLADAGAAAAALTPSKADDKTAISAQRRAVEDEIAWLNAKLATKLGPEKRITYEDLLTGALTSLKSLDPTKKAGGAGISTITSLRTSIDETLRKLGVTRSLTEPLFTSEGPGLYGAAFEHNKAYAVDGPYQTKLTAAQEASFRKWVRDNKVPFDVTASIVDYDMRGYWLAMTHGKQPKWKTGSHFPDTFKTPYDTTFSSESMYATKDNPFVWKGNNLVDKSTGELIFGKAGVVANLPPTLDDTERLAVTKLEQLRDHLKVGLSAKDLATTRSSITHWGNVLKDEISVQAKVAADAAQEAARLWQRSWTNDVNKVLRDFDQNIAGPQLAKFDKETKDHLEVLKAGLAAQLRTFDAETKKGLAALAVAQTPEEKALADFEAKRSSDQKAKAKADLQQQISDTQKQLDALGTGATGTLIDIATGTRTPLFGQNLVDQRKQIQDQLLQLQEQYNQLTLDDQDAALKAAADASRKAADDKTQADQDAYQQQRDDARAALQAKESDAEDSYNTLRDGQKTGLQNLIDDQKLKLTQDLEDWDIWLGKKQKSYADYIKWLADNGFKTSDQTPPSGETSAGIFTTPGAISRAQGGFNFARGGIGRVPGIYVGRDDTVMARYTPGEAVIDRQLTARLEDFLANGGGSGATLAIFNVNGREFARAVAEPMTAEQARTIGYTIQRG